MSAVQASITLDDVERLKKQEQSALELWKAATRRWFVLSTTERDSWRDPQNGESVLTALGQSRLLARAWAAADADLMRGVELHNRRAFELLASSAVAASDDPAPECQCYSVAMRPGEYQAVVAPECPLHGEKSP